MFPFLDLLAALKAGDRLKRIRALYRLRQLGFWVRVHRAWLREDTGR
jgi:hypothetical protein